MPRSHANDPDSPGSPHFGKMSRQAQFYGPKLVVLTDFHCTMQSLSSAQFSCHR